MRRTSGSSPAVSSPAINCCADDATRTVIDEVFRHVNENFRHLASPGGKPVDFEESEKSFFIVPGVTRSCRLLVFVKPR